MAHLKKDITTGHLLKHPLSGHLAKKCPQTCAGCMEAESVSFTVTGTGSYGCSDSFYHSGQLTKSGSEYSYSDLYAGTYKLTCQAADSWTFEVNPGQLMSGCAEPQCHGTETGIELVCVEDGSGDVAPSGSFSMSLYDYCAGLGVGTMSLSVTITPVS